MPLATTRVPARGAARALQGALIGLLAAALVAALLLAGALERLELATLDWRFRLRPDAAAAPPRDVVIVTIDQPSIEKVYRSIGYRWPWPRLFYGKMLEFLARAGARAVVFDMLFTEPDMERDIPGQESDAQLVAATRDAANVIHAFMLQHAGLEPDPGEWTAARAAARPVPPRPAHLDLPVYTTAALPAPEYSRAAAAMGFANAVTDEDNVTRRAPLAARLGRDVVPSISLAAAWLAAGRPDITLANGRLQLGDAAVPLRRDGTFYPWWYARPDQPFPFPVVPAFNVLQAQTQHDMGEPVTLDTAPFRDAVVCIGSTAAALFDVKATPLSHAVPGVMIQANAVANLVHGHAVRRVDPWLVLVLLGLASTACGAAARGVRQAVPGIAATTAVLLLALAGGWYLLAARRVFIDLVPLLAGPALAFGLATLVNYLTERRHARLVRDIFEHYLDRDVVKSLISNPARVRLGGERREGTALFADVADFTHTSEAMEPEQLVHFMNLYLDAMTGIVIEHGGFVDKFVGDEIVAIFGAPNDLPDHASCAARAVLAMQQRVAQLQPDFERIGCRGEVFFRAGLSSGPLVVGNMGSERRMNYTAMGDVMNLGARLESANKQYGTRVLVSEATAAALPDGIARRLVDRVRVKGKTRGAALYEINTALDPAQAAAYRRAFEHYQARAFDDAARAFDALAAHGDGPAAVLAARCRALREAPPPADWDGVFSLQSK